MTRKTRQDKQAPGEQPIVVRLTMRRLKWPEAEEPNAIQLLRRTSHLLSRKRIPHNERTKLMQDIDEIVQAWDAYGDLDELREQVGLKQRGCGRAAYRAPNQSRARNGSRHGDADRSETALLSFSISRTGASALRLSSFQCGAQIGPSNETTLDTRNPFWNQRLQD